MAKTIHTLAYMVIADTRQFTQGMVLTKNELKATKEIMEATTSPIKKFGGEFSALNTLLSKGAISHGQYNHSFNQLVAGHTAGIPVIGRFTSILALGNPLLIAGTVAATGFAAAMGTVAGAAVYAGMQIKNQIKEIDDLLASSAKLGISATSFLTLGHAAGLADIEIGTLESGITSMLSAISKGAGGSAKLVKVFELMGLDSKSLKEMSVEEQLTKITGALSRMGNQADKTRAAGAIFGSADFLRLNVEQIQHAAEMVDKLGGGISDLDIANFNRLDDAAKDMNLAFDLSWKKLTFAMIPAMTDVTEAITDMVVEMNRSGDFPAILSAVADIGQLAAAALRSMASEARALVELLSTLEGPVPRAIMELINEARAFGKLQQAFESKLPRTGGPVSAKGSDDADALKDSAASAKEYAKQLSDAAKAKDDLYRAGTDLASQLLFEAKTFGMSSREVALYKMEKETAGHVDLKFAKSLDRTLTEMERHKTLADEMRSALKGTRTEWEVARDTIGHYEMALKRGIISEREFGILVKKVGEDLPKAADRPAGVNPLMQGSSAAEVFLAEARVRGTGDKDKAAETVDILKSIDKHIVEGKVAVPTVVPRLGAA